MGTFRWGIGLVVAMGIGVAIYLVNPDADTSTVGWAVIVAWLIATPLATAVLGSPRQRGR